jgi:lipocalin
MHGYTLLSPQDFHLPKFTGDWYQYGVIRPWYQPHVHHVQLQCTVIDDRTVNVNVRLEHMFLKHHLAGVVKLDDVKPNFKILIPNAIFGFGLTTQFSGQAVVVAPDGTYAYILASRTGTIGLHILARTPVIPDAHRTYLLKLLVELGHDPTRLQV